MILSSWSVALLGIDGHAVEVEAAEGGGLPRTQIVGLPDKALNEAKERVKAAARASERYRRHLERWRAAALHQRIAVTDEAVALAIDVRQAVATLGELPHDDAQGQPRVIRRSWRR